ncbi:hypothetical protein OSB04_003279 [Centaurea solstitialis]|uniref:Uncharacterized protein n=1 Tax=Centaurea solstitialis TaxID=347529 RepID=A0AA38TUK0_9ASTR|nr:hypothetical protein OSB04_003279 [Centaurea solstitialis]
MDAQETVLVSKVPMLKPNEFDMWKIRIRQYMLLTDYGMWEVVENGPGTDEGVAEGGARPPPRSDADKKRRQTEMKALSTLLLAIPNEYQHQFSTYTDAKSLLIALEKRFSGTKSTKRNQKAILKQQYENFIALKNESMTQTFDRFNKLIGELATVDVKMDKDDVNRKFLRSLGDEWTIYTVSFRQGDDLEDKELEDLYNDLRIFEAEVEKKKRPIGYSHNATYNTAANETVSNTSQETNEDTILEAFLANDLEEMDIKWQMAMLTLRMKRFIRRIGRNNFDVKRGDKAGFDKSKVRCYKCNEPGHLLENEKEEPQTIRTLEVVLHKPLDSITGEATQTLVHHKHLFHKKDKDLIGVTMLKKQFKIKPSWLKSKKLKFPLRYLLNFVLILV